MGLNLKLRNLACCLGITLASMVQANDTEESTSMRVGLRDGSSLVCVINHKELPVQTVVGAVRVPVARIQSVRRTVEGMRFTLDNGDRLTGRLVQKDLALSSLAGTYKMKTDLISRLDSGPKIRTKDYVRPSVPAPAGSVAFAIVDAPKVVLHLSDGSSILGQLNQRHISLRTAYAKIQIELSKLRLIGMEKDNETATVLLQNGDKLTGVVDFGKMIVQASFGAVVPELRHVQKIYIRAPGKMTEEMRKALILQYRFDDPDHLFTDSGPKKYSGKGRGKIATGTGRNGGVERGCRFDGESAYIDISAIKASLPREKHTISVWVRPDAASLKNSTIFSNWHRELICLRESKVYVLMPVSGRANSGNGSASYILQSEEQVASGTWCHVAMTFEAGKETVLYVDGKKVASAKEKLGAGVAWYEKNFEIGRIKDFTPGRSYFKGDLDDLQIFNRALAEDEVQTLFGCF